MVASDCFVSVVAPLQDDADIIAMFVEETVAVLAEHYANYELVLVDDGSTDETVRIIDDALSRHPSIRVIGLSRRFGQEIAISAGLDSVIGDFTVVMLPATDPPALIPEMVELCRDGGGIVFGVRRNRRGEPLWLRWGAKFFYFWSNRVLDLALPANSTHFRVLSRQAVNALTQIKDRGRYLRTLSQYVGYEARSFPFDPVHRRSKPRRKSLREAVDLGASIVMANSLRPLRIVSWMGLAMGALNALYMVYIVMIYFLKEDVAEGWVTQSLQNAFMFFFLFVILAVLCEYVGLMLSEGQGRPLYYVKDEKNSSVLLLDEDRKNVVTDSTDA